MPFSLLLGEGFRGWGTSKIWRHFSPAPCLRSSLRSSLQSSCSGWRRWCHAPGCPAPRAAGIGCARARMHPHPLHLRTPGRVPRWPAAGHQLRLHRLSQRHHGLHPVGLCDEPWRTAAVCPGGWHGHRPGDQRANFHDAGLRSGSWNTSTLMIASPGTSTAFMHLDNITLGPAAGRRAVSSAARSASAAPARRPGAAAASPAHTAARRCRQRSPAARRACARTRWPLR